LTLFNVNQLAKKVKRVVWKITTNRADMLGYLLVRGSGAGGFGGWRIFASLVCVDGVFIDVFNIRWRIFASQVKAYCILADPQPFGNLSVAKFLRLREKLRAALAVPLRTVRRSWYSETMPTKKTSPKRYTITEAAEKVGITRAAIHRAIREGRLKARWGVTVQVIKTKSLLISDQSLAEFQKQRTQIG